MSALLLLLGIPSTAFVIVGAYLSTQLELVQRLFRGAIKGENCADSSPTPDGRTS